MTSKLIAIVYPDAHRAEEVLSTLKRLQSQYLIDLEDAAYVTKDKNNKLKLHQSVNLTAGGAVGGSFWGLLIGMLFFAPFAGALLGAGMGALAGSLSDYGIDDKFAKDLAKEMKPNSSAIFMLVRSVTVDKVVPEMRKYGGIVLKTSLAKETENKLQEALTPHKVESKEKGPEERRIHVHV